MRIAYIALRGTQLSDGIAQYTDSMAIEMVKKGHIVTIYTSGRYGNKNGLSTKGYFIKTVPSFRFSSIEKMSITFFASIHQLFKKYDIVHYHAMGPSIFAFMAKRRHRGVVIQTHGIEYNRSKFGGFAKKVLHKLEKWSINMGDELLACSNSLRNHFLVNYDKKTVVIHNGVSLPSLNDLDYSVLKEKNLEVNEYYLFMARISEEKGLIYLINAFMNTSIRKKLVIAGAYNMQNDFHKNLFNLAKDDHRISFVGNISGNVKENLIKGAYSFILPSESEGFSVALLEAMSYQKCCIVSNIPSNLEAVDKSGLTFISKDTNDLTRCLYYADNHPEVIFKKGEDARKRVIENFTLEITANKTEELYNDILMRKRCKNEKNN